MQWFGIRMALEHRAHARHDAARSWPRRLLHLLLHDAHPAQLYLWLFVLQMHPPLE